MCSTRGLSGAVAVYGVCRRYGPAIMWPENPSAPGYTATHHVAQSRIAFSREPEGESTRNSPSRLFQLLAQWVIHLVIWSGFF